ncbi:CPBP family intramembrane glutamic endopeptidase [Butyrivibrio sp. FCS014]|uniref:CPBP family intramembrane glutamic endopeptidase n=1 Tax=Butyrivibrio sp. FCS014 TaxID=1408304 RepID=UPI0004656913|nr:CPBP family intramembrane glutamic endopeptidase [Butyrivibrio sp. FCS014]
MKNIFSERSGIKEISVSTYIIYGLISCAVAFLLTLVFNITGLTEIESFQNASDSLMDVGDNTVILILLYCIVTPLFEEIIFRFFLFDIIFHFSKNAVVSVILTAALFGIYHLNPVQILYGFLMGLLITFAYYRYRKLSLVFLMHSLANLVALIYTLS